MTTKGLAIAVLVGAAAFGLVASAQPYAIPPEQLDRQAIFWGDPDQFEQPAEVDYQKVVTETPEFEQIKRRRLKRGTGKYWVLVSKASERSQTAIVAVAEDTHYDMVTKKDYLGSLEPPIPAEEITETVVDEVHGRRKKPEDEEKDKKEGEGNAEEAADGARDEDKE
jgi:hypothetical protein